MGPFYQVLKLIAFKLFKPEIGVPMSELAHLGVDAVPTFLELKKSKANFYNDAALSGTYPLVLRADWASSTATAP